MTLLNMRCVRLGLLYYYFTQHVFSCCFLQIGRAQIVLKMTRLFVQFFLFIKENTPDFHLVCCKRRHSAAAAVWLILMSARCLPSKGGRCNHLPTDPMMLIYTPLQPLCLISNFKPQINWTHFSLMWSQKHKTKRTDDLVAYCSFWGCW